MPATIKPLLDRMPECHNLPTNQLVNGRRLPTRAIVNLDSSGGGIMWLAFAFESVSVANITIFQHLEQQKPSIRYHCDQI